MSTPRNDVPRNDDGPERPGGSRPTPPKSRGSRPSAQGTKPRRGAKVAGHASRSAPRRQAPVPAPQQYSAYRRWYSTLHPSLQLIGLQLWMPLFFIVGFCLCYVFAFHAPHPHDVPIALIGSDPSFVQAVQRALPGEFVFHSYDSLAQAKRDVVDGSMAVAYDPAANEFFKASAHQFQVASLVPATLSAVLTGLGVATPKVTELAPLPAWDEYGTVAMYVMLAWCIGGYMVAMFIGIMGGPLRHRTRMTVIAVGGLVISLITNTLAGPVLGAIHGHWIQLVLIAWGWIVAIGLAVNGLSYFVGRFIAAPAMICFVFLSMPSSGGAYPKWFMPEPFAWLNNVVVGSSMVDMIKHQVYGVGPGPARGLITMACYAAAGLVLMYFGKQWWERKRIRAIVTGRTTMFQDANTANREFLGGQRDAELERHGLTSTETGTLSVLRDDDWEDERTGGDVFTGARDGLEPGATPTGRIAVQRPANRKEPRLAAAPHGKHADR
ncbi:membrane protein [Curtobacterium flaccumfaciens UCD-AKU]|uniref:ABC transporter permease n=1 Tax=Curtobacterium flaccumfaciens TaxID=2035 RepID=UPI00039DADDB|nr:ABC transporter permease [Curtobacterium flaccumfaciens]EYT63469.1 membrane protein [Curtobacterium flaccumfaciens UCD-AKU]